MKYVPTPMYPDNLAFEFQEHFVDEIISNRVCVARAVGSTAEEAQRRSQEISRVCNLHDELVLAAKEASITLKLAMDCFPSMKASDSHVFMRLMDAINKAEGEYHE